MNRSFKGFVSVFSFTLSRRLKGKGYRVLTIVLGLLCFLLPLIIMPLIETFETSSDADVVPDIREVYLCDLTGNAPDLNIVNEFAPEGLNAIDYAAGVSTLEEAEVLSRTLTGKSLLMIIDERDGQQTVDIVRPERSEISYDELTAFSNFMDVAYGQALFARSGEPIMIEPPELVDPEPQTDPLDGMREALSFILPYLNIMLLYFMLLFYGQGVATGVMMEKTSKLMDTMLVSVTPSALLFGKVLATALSGILQLFIWIAALALGFTGGTIAVKAINPDTDLLLIRFFESFGDLSRLFTVGGVIVSLLLFVFGFLLYCSLAAIGGALAGKQEDLSSANLLFTLALVVSFLAALYMGALEGSSPVWLDWIPFTSILITPSNLLLGRVSLAGAVGSLIVVAVTAALIVLIAGRLYKLTAFYRGKSFKPANIFSLLLKNRNS